MFDIHFLLIEIKDYQSIILSSFTDIILLLNLRYAYTPKQVRNKPGREVVTFLLVCNLAMWAINTLETNRADSHPIQVIIASLIIVFVLKNSRSEQKWHLLRHNFVLQVDFYGGTWAWPIITHISMPLAIFYRFHSTVCLCEVWKRSFKYKNFVP